MPRCATPGRSPEVSRGENAREPSVATQESAEEDAPGRPGVRSPPGPHFPRHTEDISPPRPKPIPSRASRRVARLGPPHSQSSDAPPAPQLALDGRLPCCLASLGGSPRAPTLSRASPPWPGRGRRTSSSSLPRPLPTRTTCRSGTRTAGEGPGGAGGLVNRSLPRRLAPSTRRGPPHALAAGAGYPTADHDAQSTPPSSPFPPRPLPAGWTG